MSSRRARSLSGNAVRLRRCAVGAAIVLALAVAGASWVRPAVAQETPPAGVAGQAPAFPRLRTLVVPGRDFRIDPEALFHEGERPPPVPDDVARLVDEAAVVLARDPEVAVLRVDDLAPRGAPGSPEIVVRGLLHLGLERYRDIRIPAAISVLEQGVNAALADFLDVFAPDLVSDLYLYLGLSHLENGAPALAHVAFKNVFWVTPERRFPRGYFPSDAEAALRAAALDFLRTTSKETYLGSVERTVRFMNRFRLAAGCYVYASGGEGQPARIEIRVFEGPLRKRGTVGLGTMVGFPWTGLEDAIERVSRAVTGWTACVELPSREVKVRARPRFFLDTSAAYALYLKVPTRKLFHNAGFGLGLAWQAMEGLDVFARMSLFNAFPDPYGDLIDGFWSIRGVVGLGYSLVGDWGRVFVHTGLDVNYLSDFASTTDPACKFWPGDPERCPTSRVKRPSYLVGMNAAVGVNVRVAGPISLMIQAGTTAYFFSNASTPEVNFPLVLEMGLGYAFF